MKQVIVEAFGGPEALQLVELPTPVPGPGEVLVRLTSIGMNHADLMARRGEYKLSSGNPPFTPGIEGGGVIEAVGAGVNTRAMGQRVILGVEVPRAGRRGGTYRTHYLAGASDTVLAPAAVPDELLGTLWLPYLTAWGCLIWKQQLRAGQFVAISAASSSVALAAAQIVRQAGGVAVGLTSSPQKAAALAGDYDYLVVTHGADGMLPWHRELKQITGGHGVDVFFDAVAAGPYLDTEIRALAQHGTIWIYGLLGKPDQVDVSPLIRKYGALRGWLLSEMGENAGVLEAGYRAVLDGFESGAFKQKVAHVFKLAEVQAAHQAMERGSHIGKMVLTP